MEVCGRYRCEAKSGFGGVLEVGTGVREEDERHCDEFEDAEEGIWGKNCAPEDDLLRAAGCGRELGRRFLFLRLCLLSAAHGLEVVNHDVQVGRIKRSCRDYRIFVLVQGERMCGCKPACCFSKS